jgi:hypothetical protein
MGTGLKGGENPGNPKELKSIRRVLDDGNILDFVNKLVYNVKHYCF